MRKLVIFGNRDQAQLAHYYFSSVSDIEVVAFTVDAEFITDIRFCDRPVVEFEKILELYPPDRFELFITLGYSRVNQLRKDKYLDAKKLGYKLASFVSAQVTMLSTEPVGENCWILEDNTIQPFVKIGNNVTLWSGNHVGHHSVIKDHTFVASHVVISGGVEIGEQCFIGVNATLRDHIRIGDKCVLGAGCLILADTEAGGVYKSEASKRMKMGSDDLKQI